MTDRRVFLTIITPAYNRAGLLKDCFHSLQQQTDRDFQWIVVDDGSTDPTEQVMKEILEQRDWMDICFIRKENGGKHTALNASHPYITGRYVLILDSDDTLTPDAVETVRAGWKKYGKDPRIGLVIYQKGASVEEPNCYAKKEGIPVDGGSYVRTKIVSYDSAETIKASLFKKLVFPVFEGERFLAETALWFRASYTHKSVYINKVIYICHYLEGGLTDSGRSMRVRNPKGGMYTSRLKMHKKKNMKERVKNGLLYVCYGHYAGMNSLQILKSNPAYPVLTAVCILPGYCMYRLWKRKY